MTGPGDPPPAGRRRRPVSLAVRVLVALLLVVLTGVITAWIVASLVAPPVFADHLRMAGEQVTPAATAHIEEAFRSASGVSLAVALLTALAVSVAASAYLAGRVVNSLRPFAAAAAAVADGHYDVRLDRPGLGAEFDELSEAFNRMAGQLDAVQETRRRLLADLAHEVRTPVATLRAYLEALEDGVASPDAETLAVMQAQTARLGRLAEDVAAVSRAEESQWDLRLAPVDPAELLRTARAAALDRYATKGVDLIVHVDGRLPHVRVDADRMGQVLGNLVDNALRYSPPGTVVTLAATVDGGDTVLTVTDRGEGIATDHLPHVFERFYRADAARDRAHGGSGIGLAVVKALVEAHGGRVSAGSAGPGLGSRFEIRLPGDRGAAARP